MSAVDGVWRELKTACAALRSAKNLTERQKAITQTQTFLNDDHHRRLVHKWRAWGLLLSSLLHVVKSDAQPYLNAPSSGGGGSSSRPRTKGALTSSPAGKKRRLKSGSTAPKLDYWAYLRNEFAALHALEDPVLHLDPNGRECLNQLFEFAVAVIGREPESGEDPRVAAQLEDEAWRTIELIVPFRVYCVVVDPTHLRDVLELALASLEHGNTIGLASSATLRAEVVRRILSHCPFDLHALLPRLLEFFGEWFRRVGVGSGFVALSSVEDVASKLLQAVTDVARANAAAAALPVLQHGVSVLHFIQRVWRTTKFRTRVHQTEFVAQFLALLASHAPELLLDVVRVPAAATDDMDDVDDSATQTPVTRTVLVLGDRVTIDATTLLKALRALLAMLLNAKEIQSLLLNARPARGAIAVGGSASSGIGIGSSAVAAAAVSSALFELDHPIASYFRCAADVVMHHDRLLAALLEHDALPVSAGVATSSVGVKRARSALSTTLAWERVLENICVTEPLAEGTTAAPAATAKRTSSSSTAAASAASVQKQHVSWLLLVLALVTRHGVHLVQNRIGDVMTAMAQLAHVLESKELDQRQYVALSVFVQLSHVAAQHRAACSDVLDELWQRVWHLLLRIDLPYAHATESAALARGSPGDVVLHLLGNCVLFGLVPRALVAETQPQLCALPVFRCARFTAAAARASGSSSGVVPSAAPARLLSALLRCVELRDEHGESPRNELFLPSQSQLNSSNDALEPQSLRAQLLAALFAHFEAQVALVAVPAPTRSDLSLSYAVPSVAVAAAVLAFLQPSVCEDARYCGSRLVSRLLRSVARDSRSDDESSAASNTSELDGFGVHFTFHEDGLAKLFESDADAPGPHRFSAPLQAYLSECSLQSSNVSSSTSTAAGGTTAADGAASHERFESLALPTELLAPFVHCGSTDASAFDFDVARAHDDPPSVSKEAQAAMHREVAHHFARLLRDLDVKLRAVSADPRMSMRALARAMHIGMVLACLYTELPAPALPSPSSSDSSLDVPSLLATFLALFADHFTVAGFGAAQTDTGTAACAVDVLVQFHALILILQGKATLATCAHPCAEPVDLRFPSALRASIRKVSGAIESGLTLVATGAPTAGAASDDTNSQSQSTVAALAAASSSSSWMVAATSSSSQSRVTAAAPAASHNELLFRDAFDDSHSHARSSSSSRSTPRQLRTISLWCFRVLLLLKKASGLKTVSALAADAQFPPDFVLALAALLGGVAGAESLELLLRLVDFAADDVAHKRGSDSDSFRAALFRSQALTVLKLAGLAHERRKTQPTDDVPESLLRFTQRLLDESAAAVGSSDALALELRIGRRAELECLEVFFRLQPDAFARFVDTAMTRLLDVDVGVRVAAALGTRSLFFNYPDGSPQLFRDVYNCLLPILPSTCPRSSSSSDEASQPPAELLRDLDRDTGARDVATTVVLVLYVSACSSEDVVSDVLVVFLRLAASATPLYANARSSFLHAWLCALAHAHAYATPLELLDDHFCYVWSQYLATHMHSSSSSNLDDDGDESQRLSCSDRVRVTASELLQQFPMTLFAGGARPLPMAEAFADKVDVLLPVAVLYDSLSDGDAPDDFPFVHELVRVFTHGSIESAAEPRSPVVLSVAATADVEVQLITDLFALAFVLQASVDPALQDLAARMLSSAEHRAATRALSLAHLGHVVAKMARFAVWDLARAGEQPSDVALWYTALTHMKTKYAGFDWMRMPLAELLADFYVLLLRSAHSAPLAARAVHCFALFVAEVMPALESNCVLQQLLLRICFQALRQLAGRTGNGSSTSSSSVASKLTLLVRECCAQFLATADVFGRYVSFVVHEVAALLAGHGAVALSEDDKGHLEWVVFAVCNNMANGLGKYVLDIDAVPTGVAASLDKLSALIAGSRGASGSDGTAGIAETNASATAAADTKSASASGRARRQLETFVKKAGDVGAKFYHQSRLVRSTASTDAAAPSGRAVSASASLLRLAAVETSVSEMHDALDDAEQSESAARAVAQVTTTLFHLSVRERSVATGATTSSSSSSSSNVLVAIADALSAVGSLDRHRFDLSPGSDAATLARLHQQQFLRSGALRDTRVSFLNAMYERVLLALSALLFDERVLSPALVAQATATLTRVLAHSVGRDALAKSKDGDLREFLSPFVASAPSNWSATLLTPQTQTQSHQQHAQLWRAGCALGYDAWVRRMTSLLASHAWDPVVRECANIVAMRTELAVFLFPYALWSVMQRDTAPSQDVDGSNRSVGASASADSVGSGASSGGELSRVAQIAQSGLGAVLQRAARQPLADSIGTSDASISADDDMDSDTDAEPLELVQLLVHTVTFLREVEKVQFVESNGKRLASSLSASASANDSNSSSSSSSRAQRRNTRVYGCVVDVALLDVARAALRVKMPYAAMQFVEMWLEDQHGGTIPSSLASTQTPSMALDAVGASVSIDSDADDDAARRILIDAYSFDRNVDGIYGINDGRSLASQLVTYNQEGSYTKALPLYDVALQSHSSGSGSPTQLLEGLFRSLRSLGYQHLLHGSLASLAAQLPPSASASPQIDEYRYELAWRSLQWGTAGTSLVPASSAVASMGGNAITTTVPAPYCHQRVLFQSLKALAHRDVTQLTALLRRSKQQILTSVQLSLCGLESTREAHRALLWLEAIRDIEETARVVAVVDENATAAAGADLDTGHVNSASALLDQWTRRYPRSARDFDALDSLLPLQEVLLTLTRAHNTPALLAQLHLAHAANSRRAGRVAVAYSALGKLEALHALGQLGVCERLRWHMERAKLLWTQHEARSAIWTAKRLRAELEQLLAATSTTNTSTISTSVDSVDATDREALQLLHIAVLTATGKWVASQRSENAQTVLDAYFQRATDCVDALAPSVVARHVGAAARAHLALADYLAELHAHVHARVRSREWLAGKRVAEARHRELDECNAMPEAKRLANRAHIHALKQEVLFDNEERAKVEDSVGQFLVGALSSYGRGLALSPKAELAVVFRLLALWFSNQQQRDTNAAVDAVIDAVPSYKFVPLSYQIMSRIGSPSTSTTSSSGSSSGSSSSGSARYNRGRFQHVLRKLVLKLCLQHPHHALVQLVALKNNGDVEGKGALEFRANVGDAKSDEARSYVAELRTTPQRELLESLDILANAYIQLALFDTREYHNKSKKIALAKVPIVPLSASSGSSSSSSHIAAVPFDQCLRDRTRRGSVNRTVMPGVLTCHVAPRADLDYSSVVRVLSFEPMFSITDSGIHRPKIIYCYGSDGRRFKQLVKGKDDTRQDLVIEQAFETVNHFLAEDAETRERNLRLRTYKVVPLSPIAGVLEWVDNTVPWGSYLVGRTAKRLSAHERYHPHEWKHMECRNQLKSATDKFATFEAIMTHFTPVFHHFFLEKFPDPAMWYHRRLAYVRSAAVTSIVGYILGIGDRHSQNILVHEQTAELVHIDFGVVFDQGLALVTPETVPFRLTRDIVDGMGVAGVDGVFTRCCEVTLALLRKRRASVVTILEVFVHDPLYRWTLSPLKALKIQEERSGGGAVAASRRSLAAAAAGITVAASDSDSTTSDASYTTNATGDSTSNSNNDAAARALLRVKQKLDGYEDPSGHALSIEGQVKQLISAAQDPHNLCNLFPGWAPWL